MSREKINWKKFLEDCETCCFDCGTTGTLEHPVKLIKIDNGVVLCEPCFKTAKGDYPPLKEI